MFKIASAEPTWLGILPGVRAQFAPITRAAVRAARKASRAALVAEPEDFEGAADAFAESLIRQGLLAWEGVHDAAGKALKFSPEAVEAFVGDPRLFAGADAAYVTPFVVMDAEKNASSGSGNGTSAAPTPGKRTAATAAKPARTAPTKETPHKRTTAKTPGK